MHANNRHQFLNNTCYFNITTQNKSLTVVLSAFEKFCKQTNTHFQSNAGMGYAQLCAWDHHCFVCGSADMDECVSEWENEWMSEGANGTRCTSALLSIESVQQKCIGFTNKFRHDFEWMRWPLSIRFFSASASSAVKSPVLTTTIWGASSSLSEPLSEP